MDWLHYIIAPLFCLLAAGCVVLVVVQLPGAWIMLALAVIIELADHLYLSADAGTTTFGWWLLGGCALLFGLGELIELVASMLGAKQGGASRRGMVGAMLGGVLGAIALAAPLTIIPVVGTLFGVLAGAIIGTFVGAIVGEISSTEAKTVRGSIKPATGAAIGRILATVGKVGITVVGWLVLSVAIFL
jgi:uncharacterized protein YqgC (DUF456 family)